MGLRKACKHGTHVEVCRCPQVHQVQVVPCPKWCELKEDESRSDATFALQQISQVVKHCEIDAEARFALNEVLAAYGYRDDTL